MQLANLSPEASENLTPEDLSPEDLSSKYLSSENLPPDDLLPKHLLRQEGRQKCRQKAEESDEIEALRARRKLQGRNRLGNKDQRLDSNYDGDTLVVEA